MNLIIDNYDSFTYNIFQIAGAAGADIRVIRNDELSVNEIVALSPSRVILSPGPGRPRDAGVCEELTLALKGVTPVLGICLGHQAICECFGAVIDYASRIMHGKRSSVQIANGSPVFRGLPPIIEAGRYHSLAVRRDGLPDELLVIAEDCEGEVMGVKHRDYEIYGLQFHPESILTPQGATIIENFLSQCLMEV
ncbi:MAG: aminodeoxychorismate/anthranilate synthase component II [Clostridiales Family XIII bacterium]|nr:aminodeoxychorismate/anthranilate synthase component II [Clostridiales Family XIII bacterium]